MRIFLRETVITLVLAIAAFFLLSTSVQTFVIVGRSMEPTFHDTQRLLVNKIVYNLHEPERGDVIIFRPPNNQEVDYIKRIIALPGDTIEVKDEVVYVNGTRLDESYIKSPPRYTLNQREIPENNYFVLGDNRNNSNDSHSGWLVPRQNIIGKAWLSIWPPGEWGLAANYALPG